MRGLLIPVSFLSQAKPLYLAAQALQCSVNPVVDCFRIRPSYRSRDSGGRKLIDDKELDRETFVRGQVAEHP